MSESLWSHTPTGNAPRPKFPNLPSNDRQARVRYSRESARVQSTGGGTPEGPTNLGVDMLAYDVCEPRGVKSPG